MRFPRIGRWVATENDSLLLANVHEANGFWQRFVGLQFVTSMPGNTGVLLRNCSSIHTFWMRFPIDVFFLDKDFRVVEVREAVRPWRVAIPKVKAVSHIVEANVGVSKIIEVGILTRIE
ncbi:MAG: DUF192 domain-containing protein [Planctomycetota bacterium]|nr:DUF192 domain-containing protein [Planctomycetota bacterium]